MPRVPWRVGLSKKFKKNQKFLKIPKKPKTFPKVCKHVLTMFWGNFFPQTFAQCSMEGRVFENFQKMEKIQSFKSVHTCFEHALGRCFWKFFAQCSMQCISDFLDLKIGVQFSETILNRLSFCIHATVKIRNPISGFLDSKLWVQTTQIKNVSSVFRT